MFIFFSFQKLALDCNLQQADSNKHTPVPVDGGARKDAMGRQLPPAGQPGMPEPQQYTQYQSLVKEQLTSAKDVHDMLLNYSKKISERPTPQQPPGPPPPPHPTQTS